MADELGPVDARDGDVSAGLDWYVASGRVVSFDDSATARDAILEATARRSVSTACALSTDHSGADPSGRDSPIATVLPFGAGLESA
jgi:hypothetical protein